MTGKHRRSPHEEPRTDPGMTEAELAMKKARIKGEIRADNTEFPPQSGKLPQKPAAKKPRRGTGKGKKT